MADEDTVLEEAMDNLKEAGQRIRATQSLMRSQGMTDGENYRDLLTRLSTALTMTEVTYVKAEGRRGIEGNPTHWLTDPEYAALRHRLECAYAATEAALVEARRG
jgi:hypothetical protein